jgi:adenylate cyclase
MPNDVFISYSSIDKDSADVVCSLLEANGISCWIAPRNITPGKPFAEAIIDGIRSSTVFILIYSSNSNNSRQVVKEVDRAVHHGLSIINLRLENVPMSKQLEYYISDVHWLDALTSPLEQHLNTLCKVVQMLLTTVEVKDEDIEKVLSTRTNHHKEHITTRTDRSEITRKKILIPAGIMIIILATMFLIALPVLKTKLSLSGAARNNSIAVLPFTNLSNDPEQEYFSEGLVEEILDRLCRIAALKVISRTSSSRYKNTDLPIKEIAAALGASVIMEGSVQKSSNNIRISVQLIDAKTDTHLWSKIFSKDYADIFSIYSEVAQAVAGEMKSVITPEERRLIEEPPTSDLKAYDYYLKGTFHSNKLNEKDLGIAMQYFEIAKELDPEFALAYAGIARVWACRQQMGIVQVSEAAQKSKEAIMKALELDSTLSNVQSSLAGRRVWTDWDWEGGEKAYRNAIEINPNNAAAHMAFSHLLNILGRPNEAMEHIEIALELDPLNPMIWSFYGIDLVFERRFDEAIKAAEEALRIQPEAPIALTALNIALHMTGKYEEAWETIKRSFINEGHGQAFDLDFDELGYEKALKQAAEALKTASDSTYVNPWRIARVYLSAGDINNSIFWLEKAYEEHNPNLPYLLNPCCDILRDEPRFRDLARRMGLPYKRP